MSQSSQSYSPRLTCNYTRRVLLAIVLATGTLIDIILAASYPLSFSLLAPSLTSYSSLCIVQLPCVSVTLRAALTMSQCSQSYSPHPTCYRPRRRRRAHHHPPHHHPPHSCRAHRVVFISSCSSRCAHRVVLIALCSSRGAQRVVLIALCRICQLSFVSARSVVVAYKDVH